MKGMAKELGTEGIFVEKACEIALLFGNRAKGGSNMKKLILAAAVAALVAFPAVTTAQSTGSSNPHHRVLGYQDSATGTFHPLMKAEPDTSISPSHGTIRLTINIQIKSTFPSGTNLFCTASVAAISTNLSPYSVAAEYEELASSPATVSGSIATCTVSIPYYWVIPPASTTVLDAITGSYTVEAINPTAGAGELLRSTSGDFLNLTTPPAISTTTAVTESVFL